MKTVEMQNNGAAPSVTLGQYRGLCVSVQKKVVTEKTIAEQLKQRARQLQCEEITQEIAQANGYESLDALRAEIIAQRSAIYESAQNQKLENQLWAMAAQNLTIILPEELLEQQLAQSLAQTERNLRAQGTTLAGYLALVGQTKEQYVAAERARLTLDLRKNVVADEIAKAEQITVTEEEVQAEYTRLAALRNRSVEAARKGLTPQAVAHALVVKKVCALLRETAVITYKDACR